MPIMHYKIISITIVITTNYDRVLHIHFDSEIVVYYRDVIILQYIDILQYSLQYIATFIAFKVVSIRLLHYKYDWTSRNHEYLV